MKTEWKRLRSLFDYKPSKASKAVILNSKYNGQSVRLSLQDKIIIELDSDHTPDYQWIPSEKSLKHFSQFKVDYKSINNKVPHANKVSRITLGPQRKGKGIFTLNYLQPEKPEKVLKTFSVKYEIVERA